MRATVRFERLDGRHANAFGDPLRCLIVHVDDGDDPPHVEMFEPGCETGLRGLGRVAVTPGVASESKAELDARGVALLNGPMNREWGVRTASFTDPAGNIWEIAQQLARAEG